MAEPITLAGHDPNGDVLTYTIESNPSHGALYGTGGRLEYVPDIAFTGTDSFTYSVSDGALQSNVGTVTIIVREEPCTSAQIGGPQSDLAIHVPSHLVIRDIAGGYSVSRTGAWFSENSSFDPHVTTSVPWKSRNDVTNATLTVEMGIVAQIGPPYTVSVQFAPASGFQTEVLFQSSALEIAQVGSVIETTVFDQSGGGRVFSHEPTALNLHSCNHFAVVVDDGAVVTSLNGEALTEVTDNSAAEPLTDTLDLGPFAGRAWDLRVYGRALNANELLDVGGARCGSGVLPAIQPGFPNYRFGTYYDQWWTDTADYTASELQYYTLGHDMAWERTYLEAEMYPKGRLCEFFASPSSGRTDVLGDGSGFVYMFSLESPMRQASANYWLHENFHRWQGMLDGFAGHLAGKYTVESTAEWGAYHAIPGTISSLQGYFTLVPHLALWTRENSPVEDKYMHEVKGGSQYGLGSFWAYVTQEIASSDFIGRMFDRPASTRAEAAYDLLAEQGHDMAEVYADYAARVATWDMLHGNAYSAGEVASAKRISRAAPTLHGQYFKFAKVYDSWGTGEGWARVPRDLRPQSWAHNTFKVDVDADANYQVAVRPSVTNPTHAVLESRVLVFDPQTETRTYYAFDIGDPGQSYGMVVPVRAGEELYLVVASVPRVFDGHESYDYEYAIYPVPEPPPATAPVKVYLMAGQSNMEGNNTKLTLLEQAICHADPSYSLAGFTCGSTDIDSAFIAERFATDQVTLSGYQTALGDPSKDPIVTTRLGDFLCKAGVVSGECVVGSFDLTDRMFATATIPYWTGSTHAYGYDGYRQMATAIGLAETASAGHLRADLLSARDDVSVLQFRGTLVSEQALVFAQTQGPLAPGFGAGGTANLYGPELMFGHYAGDAIEEDVLLLKVTQGGTDLRVDWKTPCSVALGINELTAAELTQDSLYDALLDKARQVLDPVELASIFPQYAGREAEIAGFVWFQGFNDGVGTDLHRENYEENLRCLVRTLREDLGQPRLPTVITQSHVNQAFSPVQVAQALIASETPFAELAVTEDLSQYYHYDSFAQLVIGQRMAAAAAPFLVRCEGFPCPGQVPTFAADTSASPVVLDAAVGGGPGILAYEWSFGDGSTGTGRTTAHAYAQPGDYRIILTTTNDRGVRMEGVQTVSVQSTGCSAVASHDLTCDGVDDDCDGFIDEDATPTGELDLTCDGIDDDCDGFVDEDATPTGELDLTCDGIDDDCDGFVDEDFAARTSICGFAACVSEGFLTCDSGVPQDSCVPVPPPVGTDTTCDGVDDDCDGAVDDDYPSTPLTCGVGSCRRTGGRVCIDATEVDICQEGAPSTEGSVCNGVDDDCDGVIDEGFVPLGPTDATCDGIDDDCDGAIDDEVTAASCTNGLFCDGVEACVAGACVPGTPVECGPTEVCDEALDACLDPCAAPDFVVSSFSEFQTAIDCVNRSNDQGELAIRLAADIAFSNSSLPDFKNTVANRIIVDGGGHVVDGRANESTFVVLNGSTVEFRDIEITGGIADHGQKGAGILIEFGDVTLERATVHRNNSTSSGGGIAIARGSLTLIDSLIDGNSAETWGGGIEVGGSADLYMVGTTVSNNTSNGRDDGGGGMMVDSGASTALIERSTISGNAALRGHGGGIHFRNGTATVRNSTFSGNTSSLDGAAVQARYGGTVDIEYATFSANTGSGPAIVGMAGASVTLTHGLIDDASACSGVASLGYNLDTDGSCAGTGVGDRPSGITDLLALGDNGGNTHTHRPGPSSEAALNGNCVTGLVDQLGNARPTGACSIGAFEVNPIELCGNGQDDNQDGLVDCADPQCDGASWPTTCGVGACAATGVLTCVGSSPQDSCTPGSPALDDSVCDLVDNDCDGPVDEDYVAVATSCGEGACGATGSTACVLGSEIDSCTSGTPATDDATCDGIDDDCDGSVDEDVTPAMCANGLDCDGVEQCLGGACVSVGAVACGAQELCDEATKACIGYVCDGSPYVVSTPFELLVAVTCVGSATSGDQKITLAEDIALPAPLPDLDNALATSIIVDGAGHAIDANETGRLFRVSRGTAVEFRNVTLTGGLTLTDGLESGGAGVLVADGDVTFVNSRVVDNQATGFGGGVAAYKGRVVLIDSLINGNVATSWGGGMFVGKEADLTMLGTTVSNNQSTGRYDAAGGLFIHSGSSTTLIEGSTITGNIASTSRVGGIHLRHGSPVIRNSTISGNSSDDGAEIHARYGGVVAVEYSTVGENTGSGATIAAGGGASLTLFHTIAAGSGACSGAVSSLGYTLDADGACTGASPTDLSSGVLDLLPLADNGGPTLTRALGPSSDAIDAGSCAAGLFGQRGVARAEPACDIGAVEIAATETGCEGGLDEDLDGMLDCADADCDDILLATTSCGVGACVASGSRACVGGVQQDTCLPGIPAASDGSCNGVDDDCDGSVDEDYGSSPSTCGLGACGAVGTTSCLAGSVVDSCTPGTPAPDDRTCDLVDDDCDGAVDEEYGSVATDCGVGACAAAGATSCVLGLVVDSCTPGAPAPDDSVCDGIDNDCDVSVDEDYVSAPTTCGVGACSSAGVTSCVLGTIHNDCTPGIPAPNDETCDMVDDDCDGVADEDCVTPVVTAEAGTKIAPSVGWVRVSLENTYVSPVVVTTAEYTSAGSPRLVRVRNASASSFEVQVAPVGSGAVGPTTVYYLVVEEGVYDNATRGAKLEAVKYLSTVTDENDSWLGEARAYQQAYSSPVVLGQVMSANDSAPSVFWAQGSVRANPPDAATLRTGKTVNEDPNDIRANETVGYIVFEQGAGTLAGRAFAALLGADSVAGVGDMPPYTYPLSGLSSASIAIMSLAGMDDGDGGWPVVYGPLDPSGASVGLAVDEDTLGDAERSHTTEQVAVLVLEDDGAPPPNNPAAITDPRDQLSLEGDTVSLSIVATDSDSDALQFGASNLPSGLSIDANSGVISGEVAAGASASSPYDVVVTVDDGEDPVVVELTWTINAAVSWIELQNDDFESGWGNWSDGGSDCRRSWTDAAFAHQGTYAIRIRDNSGSASSFYTTQGIDVTAFDELRFEFWYRPESMESGEDFFVEYWDGTDWIIIGQYVSGIDFTNGSFYNPTIALDSANVGFPADARVRFRCDASSNGDRVYIDEVLISGR